MQVLKEYSIYLVLAAAHRMDSYVIFFLVDVFTIEFIVCIVAWGIELGLCIG